MGLYIYYDILLPYVGETGVHWDTGYMGHLMYLEFPLIIGQCDTSSMMPSQYISGHVNLDLQ